MSTTPQNVLQSARQGNPEAIAALMNQHLQARGITAQVTQQGDALHVSLESAQTLSQKELVSYIEKGITGLSLTDIHHLSVSGKQTGHEIANWTETIALHSSPGRDIDSPVGNGVVFDNPGANAEDLDLEPSLANGNEASNTNLDLDLDLDDFEASVGVDDLDLVFDSTLGEIDADDLLDLGLGSSHTETNDTNLGDLDFGLPGAPGDAPDDLDLNLDADALEGSTTDLDTASSDLELIASEAPEASWLEPNLTQNDGDPGLDIDLAMAENEPSPPGLDELDLDFSDSVDPSPLNLDSSSLDLDFADDSPPPEPHDLELDLESPLDSPESSALDLNLGDSLETLDNLDFPEEANVPGSLDLNLDFEDTTRTPDSSDLNLDLGDPLDLEDIGDPQVDVDFNVDLGNDLDLDDSSQSSTDITFDLGADELNSAASAPDQPEQLESETLNLAVDLESEEAAAAPQSMGEGLERDLWETPSSTFQASTELDDIGPDFDVADPDLPELNLQSPREAEPVDLMLSEELDLSTNDDSDPSGIDLMIEDEAFDDGTFLGTGIEVTPDGSDVAPGDNQDFPTPAAPDNHLGFAATAAAVSFTTSQSPVHKLLSEEAFKPPAIEETRLETEPSSEAEVAFMENESFQSDRSAWPEEPSDQGQSSDLEDLSTPDPGLKPEDFPIFDRDNDSPINQPGADWEQPQGAGVDSDTLELDTNPEGSARALEPYPPAIDDFPMAPIEDFNDAQPLANLEADAAAIDPDLPQEDFDFDDNLSEAGLSNGFMAAAEGDWSQSDEPDVANELIDEVTGHNEGPISTSVNLTEEELDNLDNGSSGASVNWLVGIGLGVVGLGLAGILVNALLGNLRQPPETPITETPVETPVPTPGETDIPPAVPPAAIEPESDPEPATPGETPPGVDGDYFRQAVNAAQNAANLAQTASTAAEWQAVVDSWSQAIALMQQVPESDPNYAVAQQKAVDYQPNLQYAQQNAQDF